MQSKQRGAELNETGVRNHAPLVVLVDRENRPAAAPHEGGSPLGPG